MSCNIFSRKRLQSPEKKCHFTTPFQKNNNNSDILSNEDNGHNNSD